MSYRFLINSASVCDLALDECRLQLRAGGPDQLTFTYAGDPGGAAPYSLHQTITLTAQVITPAGFVSGTETLFYGRVTSVRAVDQGTTGGWQIVAENGWGDLKRITLTQTWASYTPTVPPVLTTREVSRVLLGMDDEGNFQNTGQILADLITRAAAKGANLAAGSITPTLSIPPTEVIDATIDSAFRQILAYHPDHIAWVENGQTMNVRDPAGLDTIALDPCAHGFTVDHAPLTGDTPSGVVITWERTHTLDGIERIERIHQTAGSTTGWPPALYMTIPLAGSSTITKSQAIETRTLPDPEDLNTTLAKNFFKGLVPEIADAVNTDLAITGYSIAFADPKLDGFNTQTDNVVNPNSRPVSRGDDLVEDFPRMLVSGEVQPWFPSTIKQYDAVVKAKIWYRGTNAAIRKFVGSGIEISEPIQITNARPKTYRVTDSVTLGQNPIEGLATAYYNAISAARNEGTLSGPLAGQWLSLRPGRRVTVSGYLNTPAPIMEATIDCVESTITARYGASEYLNPKTIADLGKALSRNRPSWKRGEERTQAKADSAGGGPIKEGMMKAPDRYSSVGSLRLPTQPWDLKVTDPTGPTVSLHLGTIISDLSDLTTGTEIISGTSTFTVEGGHLIWLKLTKFDEDTFDPVKVTLESGPPWSVEFDYPSAVEITGTLDEAKFTAFRLPLWEFTETAGDDTIPIGSDLYGRKLVPGSNFIIMLGTYQTGSNYPVVYPFLMPWHRKLS